MNILDKKFTLSPQWIIRHDKNLKYNYWAFDIITDKKIKISQSLFYILMILKYDCMSINELYTAIGQRFSRESLRKMLLESPVLMGILKEAKVPYRSRSIVQFVSTEDRYSDIAVSNFPIDAEIHLTEKCNLTCRHCGYSCSPKTATEEIMPEDWINVFKQFEIGGLTKLVVSGGELFLYSDIAKILEDLRDRMFKVALLTNATLIKKEHIPLLKSSNIGLDVSLDGIDIKTHEFLRGSGTYQKTTEMLKTLSKEGVRSCITTTVHKYNIHQIEEIIRFAINLKLESVNFVLIDKIGRAYVNEEICLDEKSRSMAKETVSSLQNKYKSDIFIGFMDPLNPLFEGDYSSAVTKENKVYCSGGTTRIAIAANGDVYPCVYGYGFSEYIAGNVRENNLFEIWNTPKWEVLRGQIKVSQLEHCSACSLLKKCSLVNCRLRAKAHSNSIYGVSHNCLKFDK